MALLESVASVFTMTEEHHNVGGGGGLKWPVWIEMVGLSRRANGQARRSSVSFLLGVVVGRCL